MRIVQRLTQGLTDLDVEAEYVFLHVKDSSIKLDVAFCDCPRCLETSVEGYLQVSSRGVDHVECCNPFYAVIVKRGWKA